MHVVASDGYGSKLTFLGEAMFLMRLYAAYSQSKLILVIIVSLYTAELAVGVVTATLIVTSLEVYERPAYMPFPGCLVNPPSHPELSIMAWSVALGTTCIYFLLILYKFANTISLRREGTSPGKVSIWELGTISPLLYAFLRDSTFYFFLVFAGNFMNLLFEIIFQGRALSIMGTNWLSAIYSISASRVCLNTRESIQRRRFAMDTAWLGDMDALDIAIPGANNQSNRRPDVENVDDGRHSPVIVFTRSTSKFSLRRSSFDSEARQDGFLTPSTSKDKKRSSVVSAEDFELVSVLSWKTDERIGQAS
ncbi:hypothetical protein GSI_09286 [Ganoderma sinense ZZ0214-1]|uniref:Uncharacterized protein n=1 Tax=Ganoderma sinense ZZ0214-1 TaxID=1077348 RepID=A0A2G8S671_9APHY|nr:hypothetical protein GSI_09286 [Ganoderma sinense ZZ0214-1]